MNNDDLLQDEVRRLLQTNDETLHWLSDQGPDVPFETKPGRGSLVWKGPFEDTKMPEPTKFVRFANIVPSSPFKDNGISRPGPAPNVTHLSACIDPKTLDPHVSVVSPSGERMDYDHWFQDPERPPSIRERQEAIMQKFQMQTRVASTIRSEKGRKTFRRRCWLKSILMMFGSSKVPELSLPLDNTCKGLRDTRRRFHEHLLGGSECL
ncbi:hypothetical protein MMC14_010789 [Varicellaria rhodocarpa]|nr:hypothetical protein [Varicellaria rhodocarpa]